jgi:hypothetical protein
LAAGGTAQAAPWKLKGGSPVRVVVNGTREAGVGLKAEKVGWKVATTSTDAVAEVVDITDGAGSAKWVVEVRQGALLFDSERFIAGHAYRVTMRHGMDSVGAALVYLYPPHQAKNSRVTFEDESASMGGLGMDGELGIMKKPTL